MMRKLKRKEGSRFGMVCQRVHYREPSGFLGREPMSEITAEQKNRLSVCFTGHRYMSSEDVPTVTRRLDELLKRMYQMGYRDFLCGGALGFDTLAGERVARFASAQPDVRLIMVIPCSDQSRYWPSHAIPRYERLLYMADEIKVLAPAYYEGCMQVRNRYLVDHSDLCVCYLRHHKGGTASTVAYANAQGIPVFNIAMENTTAFLSS